MPSVNFKEEILNLLLPHLKPVEDSLKIDVHFVEIPPDPKLGDYAFPCFKLARYFRKSPVEIAKDLAGKVSPNKYFSKIEPKGPYLNFFVNKTLLAELILTEVYSNEIPYGHSTLGKGKNIVIDYSSPNIAKPFGIAHIRSTVIGNSLYHILSALGYNVVRVNHLGDWGTQFGKLMVAYKEWGDEKELEKDGINYLVKIYVEFGEKAKKDPSLLDRARKWFKALEDGEKEAVEMWEKFRSLSLKKFKEYYDLLGVEFDYYQGEAFYNDQLEDTIKFIMEKIPDSVYESEGALVVDLKDKGIKVPLLLRKSDGATTYHTRDLAAALYRIRTFHPEKILYVVGAPQKLHFQQLFATLEKCGFDRSLFEHIPFGNMTYEGVMMSTRKGNFILLTDVLNKAIDLALKIIEEKNPDLPNKEEVAKQVGIGAIIFGDLSNDRVKDVDFRWEIALNFDGDTGPYLQYTHARICSIERKVGKTPDISKINYAVFKEDVEHELIKKISRYPETILEAARVYKPSVIATYLLELAQTFNKFYARCRIKGEVEEIENARLALASATRKILSDGLGLLGIAAPERM